MVSFSTLFRSSFFFLQCHLLFKTCLYLCVLERRVGEKKKIYTHSAYALSSVDRCFRACLLITINYLIIAIWIISFSRYFDFSPHVIFPTRGYPISRFFLSIFEIYAIDIYSASSFKLLSLQIKMEKWKKIDNWDYNHCDFVDCLPNISIGSNQIHKKMKIQIKFQHQKNGQKKK